MIYNQLIDLLKSIRRILFFFVPIDHKKGGRMGRIGRWFFSAIGLPEEDECSDNRIEYFAGVFYGAVLSSIFLLIQLIITQLLSGHSIDFEKPFNGFSAIFGLATSIAVYGWQNIFICFPIILMSSAGIYIIWLSMDVWTTESFIEKIKNYLFMLRAALVGGLLTFGLVGLAVAIMVLFAPAIRRKHRSRVISHALC